MYKGLAIKFFRRKWQEIERDSDWVDTSITSANGEVIGTLCDQLLCGLIFPNFLNLLRLNHLDLVVITELFRAGGTTDETQHSGGLFKHVITIVGRY